MISSICLPLRYSSSGLAPRVARSPGNIAPKICFFRPAMAFPASESSLTCATAGRILSPPMPIIRRIVIDFDGDAVFFQRLRP